MNVKRSVIGRLIHCHGGKEFQCQVVNFFIDIHNRLTCKDFIIGFAEKIVSENPNIRVKFLAGYLWSYGYDEAYAKFLSWFSCFGSGITDSRLSRLDICVDTDEVVFFPEDVDFFTTRAKVKATHFVSDEYKNGRKFSGFTIGRGDSMLARIYNKSEEIKISGKDWFKDIWRENGWTGDKDIWRVEFQLRRKALKELSLSRVEDLSSLEEELWQYLTTKWLRMNDDRWAILANPKQASSSPLIREKVLQGDLNRLLNQAAGLMLSIGALSACDSIDDALAQLKAWSDSVLYKKKPATRLRWKTEGTGMLTD